MILLISSCGKGELIRSEVDVADKPVPIILNPELLEPCEKYYFTGENKAKYIDVKKMLKIEDAIIDLCNKKLTKIREVMKKWQEK